MHTLKRKWLLYSISGLILLGAGLSMAIDAAFYRLEQPQELFWIAYGTFALVIFNSGICLFGQGILYKVRLDHK